MSSIHTYMYEYVHNAAHPWIALKKVHNVHTAIVNNIISRYGNNNKTNTFDCVINTSSKWDYKYLPILRPYAHSCKYLIPFERWIWGSHCNCVIYSSVARTTTELSSQKLDIVFVPFRSNSKVCSFDYNGCEWNATFHMFFNTIAWAGLFWFRILKHVYVFVADWWGSLMQFIVYIFIRFHNFTRTFYLSNDPLKILNWFLVRCVEYYETQ